MVLVSLNIQRGRDHVLAPLRHLVGAGRPVVLGCPRIIINDCLIFMFSFLDSQVWFWHGPGVAQHPTGWGSRAGPLGHLVGAVRSVVLGCPRIFLIYCLIFMFSFLDFQVWTWCRSTSNGVGILGWHPRTSVGSSAASSTWLPKNNPN
jgi:hypothetical protein